MLADIGSLGDGGLAGFQRNRRVHRIVRDLKIGDRLLAAVVGDGVRFALDLDDNLRRVLRDGQRAGLEDNIVIGGDFSGVDRSVFVYDLEFVDIVQGAAGIGDSACGGHGDGEVILRIAVDEAIGGECAAGEGSAVIRLAVRACREGQGRLVENANDVLCLVLVDRRVDVSRVDRQLADEFRIERRALAVGCTQRRADGLAAGLVGGDLRSRSGEIVVDGVLRGVELEVYLQDERAVRFDLTGEDVSFVGLVKDVTVFLRALIFKSGCDSCADRALAHSVRSGRFLSEGVVRLLVVILNGIIRRGLLPLGIEDVAVLPVHAGVFACLKGRAGAVRSGVPAGELIVQTGEAKIVRRRHLDPAVVQERRDRPGSSRAAVRVVGQLDGLVFVAVHGVELRARRRNGQLIVGLIGDVGAALFGRPTEEHLALGRVVLGLLHVRLRAGHIGLAVGVRLVRPLDIAHPGEIFVGEGGIQRIGTIDFGVGVERNAVSVLVLGHPAGERPAVARRSNNLSVIYQLLKLFFDRFAVSDRDRLGGARTRHRDKGNVVKGRLYPLGIDDHVVGGHLAGEIVRRGAGGIVIPSAEGEVFLSFRLCGSVFARVGDGLIKQLRDRVYLGALAAVFDRVAVALIVELRVVVIFADSRAAGKGKASDGILILFGDTNVGAGGGIAVVQLVGFVSISRRPALVGQDLHIVVRRYGAASGLRSVEICAVERHGVDVALIGNTAAGIFRCSPCGAAADGGPLVADARAVLGGNGQLADSAAGGAVGMLFLAAIPTPTTPHIVRMFLLAAGIGGVVQMEGDGILLAREVHIDDRGAVARDGLFSKLVFRFFAVVGDRFFKVFVCGDAVGQPARACLTGGQRNGVSGFAGGFHGGIIGVSVVVGVFDPVVNGIGGAALGFPLRGERNALLQHPAERERGAGLVEPALERIAGLRRGFGCDRRFGCAVEPGRDVRAAVGIVVDPVTLFDLGINGDVLIGQRDGVGGRSVLKEPADNGFVRAVQRVGLADGADGHGVARVFLRDDDAFRIRLGEEEVQHGRELRIRRDGPRLGDAGHRAERNGIAGAVFLGVPAGELVAVLLRGGGAEERFVILDDLLGDLFLAYVKFVGAVAVLVGQDHRERNAVLPVLGVLLVGGGFVLGFFSFGGLLRAGGLFALGGRFAVLGFFSLGGLLRAGGLFALGGRFAVSGFLALDRRGGFAVFGFLALDRRGGFAAFAVLGGRLLLRGA